MLSRNAQGLYWMGRYLERVEHLCRLLRLQVEALVDRPIPEIHFGWRRIYACLDRQPPLGGGFEPDESDDYTLADSFTLAGDLTFERSNPDSIRSCFALGRENARQMRHCISAEMWTCLNLGWLRIRDLEIEDIWKVSPESFYAQTTREIDTFTGWPKRPCTATRAGVSCGSDGSSNAPNFWLRCSWLSSPPAECRTKPPARTGRACCAHARHSTPTNATTASRSGRTECSTCS